MKNTLLAAALLGSMLMVGTERAMAQSTAQSTPVINLQLGYNGDDAKLRMKFRFDRARTRACRLRVTGGISYPGDVTFSAKRVLFIKRFTNNRRFILRVDELNGVRNNSDGELPILSVQARLTCGNLSVNEYSEAKAVYVNCGVSRRDIRAERFLRELAAKLKDGASDIS